MEALTGLRAAGTGPDAARDERATDAHRADDPARDDPATYGGPATDRTATGSRADRDVERFDESYAQNDDAFWDGVLTVPPKPRLPAAAAASSERSAGLVAADSGWRRAGPAAATERWGRPHIAHSDRRRTNRPDRPLATLYLLTLISTIDGTLLLLAAAGHLDTLGGAVLVGLLVIAGSGTWLAAHSAFGGRRRTRGDWTALGVLAVATFSATVTSAWLGLTVGQAVTLHVLPKAAGVVLCLVAGEVAGLRLRVGKLPAPIAALAAAALLEVAILWTP